MPSCVKIVAKTFDVNSSSLSIRTVLGILKLDIQFSMNIGAICFSILFYLYWTFKFIETISKYDNVVDDGSRLQECAKVGDYDK